MSSVLSMTVDRALVIEEREALAVPYPAAVDDVYLSTQPGQINQQPVGYPCHIEFYIQSLKLSLIQETIMSTMYSDEAVLHESESLNLPGVERVSIDELLRISSSLDLWYETLPFYLRTEAGRPPDRGMILVRQGNMLHIR